MTTIVNLFGGPGVGKSTTATGVFSALKQKDISCEYVSEYAKDLVWEETASLLNNQIHVFSEQLRRQWRLLDKVDYVITDSPLLLSAVYFDYWMHQSAKKFSDEFAAKTKDYFLSAFNEFNNLNFYIFRAKKYHQAGRLQTLEEAQEIDYSVISFLDDANAFYYITDSNAAIAQVTRFITEEVQRKEENNARN